MMSGPGIGDPDIFARRYRGLLDQYGQTQAQVSELAQLLRSKDEIIAQLSAKPIFAPSSSLSSEGKNLVAENGALRQRLSSLERELAAVNQTQIDRQSRTQELEGELSRLQAIVTEGLRATDTLSADSNIGLRAERDQLRQEVDRLKEQVQNCQDLGRTGERMCSLALANQANLADQLKTERVIRSQTIQKLQSIRDTLPATPTPTQTATATAAATVVPLTYAPLVATTPFVGEIGWAVSTLVARNLELERMVGRADTVRHSDAAKNVNGAWKILSMATAANVQTLEAARALIAILNGYPAADVAAVSKDLAKVAQAQVGRVKTEYGKLLSVLSEVSDVQYIKSGVSGCELTADLKECVLRAVKPSAKSVIQVGQFLLTKPDQKQGTSVKPLTVKDIQTNLTLLVSTLDELDVRLSFTMPELLDTVVNKPTPAPTTTKTGGSGRASPQGILYRPRPFRRLSISFR